MHSGTVRTGNWGSGKNVTMIGTFARELAGFVLSCLTAGLVQVVPAKK